MSGKNEFIEDAAEQMEDWGVSALDKFTKKTKTRIVYDSKHKIYGFKNDKR